MDNKLENNNPTLYNKSVERCITADEQDDQIRDLFDEREIFGKIIAVIAFHMYYFTN